MANRATALIRSARRCTYVHRPTGPVRSPTRSPLVRSQPSAPLTAPRARTALTDGPEKNAPMATIRPTTSSVRSPSLMNRISVSYRTAAALAGSTLFGTLFR